MTNTWKAPERNRENIQFAFLRNRKMPDGRTFDEVYEQFHDALSEHYYRERDLDSSEQTPFVYRGKDYGPLNKVTFDELHGLIWHYRELAFDELNRSLPALDRIPEEAYNRRPREGQPPETPLERSRAVVDAAKAKGLELAV